ncbi:MAG: metallophosphoesterase [Pseudomonadales bacterium]
MKIFKRVGLTLLAIIAILALAIYINPQYADNHDTAYIDLHDESTAPAPAEADIIQRIVVYGDAGHSTTEPWQASMAKVAERASISPEKTVVIALGDNIYMQGYPQKEEGQEDWDEDQLESISFLESQLKVAKVSNAQMFLVPGNHDWYATEVASQARHVGEYAIKNNAPVAFRPHQPGQPPLPESADFPGVSLVFVDSEWLIQNDAKTTAPAYAKLDAEIARIRAEHPDNLIITAQHHPMETMGQHGGYMTHFSYWFFINAIDLFFDMNQDIGHPDYDNYVAKVTAIMAKYDRVIHASGHEHSLQLFKPPAGIGASYNLVSGAGNSNKISGVWHNKNNRFALSQEGFMELAITGDGTYIKIFDIHQQTPAAEFWLDI